MPSPCLIGSVTSEASKESARPSAATWESAPVDDSSPPSPS